MLQHAGRRVLLAAAAPSLRPASAAARSLHTTGRAAAPLQTCATSRNARGAAAASSRGFWTAAIAAGAVLASSVSLLRRDGATAHAQAASAPKAGKSVWA